MKRVLKGDAPHLLIEYTTVHPDSSWVEMSEDNTFKGSQAAHACRNQTVSDQFGLCAYCEQKISSAAPTRRRLEHFHPKSDNEVAHNWGLDWENMLATCDGGSWRVSEDELNYPLPDNLSCDEHKNHMVSRGKLPVNCEGYLINPLSMPAFPNLFSLEGGSWKLLADEKSCTNVTFAENTYFSTFELVCQTINILNLNCDRLVEERKQLVFNINRNIKTLRDKGYSPNEVPGQLVSRYFNEKWPKFFTTLRCFIGTAVDDYLKVEGYNG